MLLNENSKKQDKKIAVPRLVIGAPQGRSGKTTFTLGLLRALTREGVRVQPFKKGPDYIDASWHSTAAGVTCRNLDSFFMSGKDICSSLIQNTAEDSLAIIEGSMGLYDGVDMVGSSSTAEVAKITQAPVVLVVDATRMTRSVAAMVMGFQHFDPAVNIAAVILNKVARPRHQKRVTEAIEHFCNIPVLGAIPRDASLTIPDRHLGLVLNGELDTTDEIIDSLARVVREHVDLSKLIELAHTAPALNCSDFTGGSKIDFTLHKKKVDAPKIGVIKDQSFSFYYPENLEALVDAGATLEYIDSLNNSSLPPDLDGLYIGGGFPEVFASELEKNCTFRAEVRLAAEQGLPLYAECGGLMYLGRSISTQEGKFEMVGLLPYDVTMTAKPQGHGYTILKPCESNFWFDQAQQLKGHEFHNSKVINLASDVSYAFEVQKGHGLDGKYDGICYKNVLATYNHIHALGCPAWAHRFVQLAQEFKNAKWSNKQSLYCSSTA